MSDKVKEIFEKSKKLGEIAEPRQGMATGDNDRFLRLWFETEFNNIGFNFKDINSFHSSHFKYAPYNKAGELRKWFGNQEFIIKFDKKNYNNLAKMGNNLPSRQFYFNTSISWSLISSTTFGARFYQKGFVFDVGGSSTFPQEKDLLYIHNFLHNS